MRKLYFDDSMDEIESYKEIMESKKKCKRYFIDKMVLLLENKNLASLINSKLIIFIMKYEKIGVIFPSFYTSQDTMDRVFTIFEQKGFKIITARNNIKNVNGFAGTDEERIKEIHNIFLNPNIDIVIPFCGGIGLSRIVDKIDYSIIKRANKVFLGYSDLTLLHNAIIKYTDMVTYHAPMLEWSLRDNIDIESQEYFFNFLNGFENNDLKTKLFTNVNYIRTYNKKIIAKSIGGNLEALVSSIGTNNDFNTDDKILLLENVGNKISQVHEMLQHLKRAGKFKNIKALLVGGMNYIDMENNNIFKTTDDLILDILKDYSFPIITNCPFGHDRKKIVVKLNSKISIDFVKKEIYW